MKNKQLLLSLLRMPDNGTLVELREDGYLRLSKVVPFDFLLDEIRDIDQNIYCESDCFFASFLPDVTRLVSEVRKIRKLTPAQRARIKKNSRHSKERKHDLY
jgi:hypothetical protein